jgi:AraC-like DNA-binding protein
MKQRRLEIPGSLLLQILSSDILPDTIRERIESTLRQAGVDQDVLARPHHHVPLEWLGPLFDPANGILPWEFAVRLGAQVRLTSHGRLGLLLMTGSSVREVADVIPLLPLITSAVGLHLVLAGDGGYLYISPRTGTPLLNTLIVYYCMAAIDRLIGLLSGGHGGLELHLAESRPPGFEHLPGLAHHRWHFDAPAHCIRLSPELVDYPLLFADPVMHRVTHAKCEQDLQALLPELGIKPKVIRILENHPDQPGLEEVAALLNLSARTLKRKLQEEDCTFTELAQENKRLRAVLLLTGTSTGCQEIAYQLGYSIPSSFTHAFEQWTGMSPREFRKRMRPRRACRRHR